MGVHTIAAEHYRSGCFSAWEGPLSRALTLVTTEDVDACFSFLAAEGFPKDADSQDALLVAVGHTNRPDFKTIAQRLIEECGADVDAATDLAVEYEDVEVVLRLLRFPTASNRRWVRQWALRRTCMVGDVCFVKQVLDLPGLEVNDGAETLVGPPLVIAAESGCPEICRLLL